MLTILNSSFRYIVIDLQEVIPMSSGSCHISLNVLAVRSAALLLSGRATTAYALSPASSRSAHFLLPVILGTALVLSCFVCLLIALRSRKREQLLRHISEELHLTLQEERLTLWDWDLPTGHVTYRLTGTSPDRSGSSSSEHITVWKDLIHPHDLDKVQEAHRKYLEGTTPSFQCEHRLKTDDGDWKWVLSSGHVRSRDHSGTPTRFSGIHWDITKLGQDQKGTRESQNLLESFIRSFPGSAFIEDQDFRTVYPDPRATVKHQEGSGSHPFDSMTYSPEIAKTLSLHGKLALEKGKSDFLIDLPDRENTNRTFHVFKFRIDRGNSPPLIGNIAFDIHEQKKQQETFRSLLNALPDPTILMDRTGIVLAANLSACRDLGRSLEEIVNRPYFELLPVKSAMEARKYVGTMKRTLSNISFEEERDHLFFRNTFFPVLDDKNEYQGFAAVAFNITRTKQAELSFQTSEAQLRTVIDTVPHRISTQDSTGRFVLLNRAAASLYGLSPNDMKGLKPGDLLPSDSATSDISPDDLKVIETGQPLVIPRERVLDRRGENLIQKTIKMPILLSESGEMGILAVSVDITDLVKAEDQIRKFTEELEEKVHQRTGELEAANRELSTFAYTVSHDLRAPLRAMEGFARILIDEKGTMLDDEGKRFLERIAGAGKKMNLLIEGLLQFSRGSRREMVHFSIPLSDLAMEITSDLHASAPERDVRFVIEPNIKAFGDPQLLKIVLENLLGNAWKFTSKQKSATIRFGTTQTARGQAFFVSDNGPGFKKDRSEIIFNVFERLHPESVYEGSGIGLATVRRIQERHGGQVWAFSEEGKGATFFFTLPGPGKHREENPQLPAIDDRQKAEEAIINKQRRYRP